MRHAAATFASFAHHVGLAGLTVSAALACYACSGSSNTRGTFDPDTTSSTADGGGGSSTDPDPGTIGGTGGTGDAGTDDGCSEAAKLVYVVSAENTLYSFAPDTLTFTEIGELACPAGAATPNSMAVDRSGTAWVNFSDGSLFEVSTKDASCKATSFEPGQHGYGRFGMAFASNQAGSQDETLFVSGIGDNGLGNGLAKIDLKTFTLTPIGDYDGDLEGQGAELTGTGDGRLYGFFTTFPSATFAEIDKSSAVTSGNEELDGVSTGSAWAFSFWGGDFWFYTSPGGVPSSVTRLAASDDGAISVVKQSVGNVGRIVGAGVSTCAPTTPPH